MYYMTNEEAINTIKTAIAEVEWYYPMDYAIAFEIAISALEKRIPKKPIDICTPVVTWGRCPICKGELNKLGGRPNRVFKSDAFCHDCGQAIDWSDTE